jgi:Winged helix-turn helix
LIFGLVWARLPLSAFLEVVDGAFAGAVRPAGHDGRRSAAAEIGWTVKDPVKLRRAPVVLVSAQGQSVPDIAHLLKCSQEYVRKVIHDFNGLGFKALDPKWSGGRPKTISEAVRHQIQPGAAPAILDCRFQYGV